ncbi:hypothetical protein PHISCL_03757 [Aspergillus sclerotialis]|uniref:Cyclin-dependent protein kinase regulator Pho80 n=1 Tax=Aspergillus sclerotialis TaxID=2070753 RepID=A0A3A2ZNT9_9EURO|nr:hypothetical protein PHISCL_03757 [Aspergillus sclerotialis]
MEMLASSPSPSSANLRSGLSSTSSSSPPPPHLTTSHPPQSSHSHHLQYENSCHPATVTGDRQFTPRSSRVAIEELRSALNRHTVDSASSRPSGDLPCGRIPAGQTSLEGGNHTATSSNPDPSGVSTVGASSPSSSTAPPMPVAPNSSGPSKRSGQDESIANAAPTGVPNNSDMEVSQPKRLRSSGPGVKLLPERYELANTSDIVFLISSMLMELIQLNDKIPLHQGRLTRFHSRSPPRISVHDYLQRLTTHATLSPPILLSMVYYIDRLCALYPAFTVSSLTIHRFLIASATVASKGLSDSFWTNKTYARVGGISMTELALLEMELLTRVEWRIVPQPEVLEDYYQSLVVRCDGYEIQRGESNT